MRVFRFGSAGALFVLATVLLVVPLVGFVFGESNRCCEPCYVFRPPSPSGGASYCGGLGTCIGTGDCSGDQFQEVMDGTCLTREGATCIPDGSTCSFTVQKVTFSCGWSLGGSCGCLFTLSVPPETMNASGRNCGGVFCNP